MTIVEVHHRNEPKAGGGPGLLPLVQHDAAVRGLLRAAAVAIRVAVRSLLRVADVATLDRVAALLLPPRVIAMKEEEGEKEEEVEEESTAMGEGEEEEEEGEGGQGRCQPWARSMKERSSRSSLMALLSAFRASNGR